MVKLLRTHGGESIWTRPQKHTFPNEFCVEMWVTVGKKTKKKKKNTHTHTHTHNKTKQKRTTTTTKQKKKTNKLRQQNKNTNRKSDVRFQNGGQNNI